VKYAFIDAHRRHWPVSLLCEQLEVSASGYHQHSLRKDDQRPDRPVRRNISNDALLAHIKAIHAEVKGEYGWPRMCVKGNRIFPIVVIQISPPG